MSSSKDKPVDFERFKSGVAREMNVECFEWNVKDITKAGEIVSAIGKPQVDILPPFSL